MKHHSQLITGLTLTTAACSTAYLTYAALRGWLLVDTLLVAVTLLNTGLLAYTLHHAGRDA